MDYEKPEALNPLVYPHTGHQSPQPDGEATLHSYDEPSVVEDRREFRGDSLWYGIPTSTARRPVNPYLMIVA